MANAITVQTLMDGPRNTVLKVDGYLDTSDYSATSIVDPASLSPIDPSNRTLATQLILRKVQFSVDEGLAVTLLWDATTAVRIVDMVKSGKLDLTKFGGIPNTKATGWTGKILLSTEGWSSGKIYEFTLIVEMVKG